MPMPNYPTHSVSSLRVEARGLRLKVFRHVCGCVRVSEPSHLGRQQVPKLIHNRLRRLFA
jgi:hypothetical protein